MSSASSTIRRRPRAPEPPSPCSQALSELFQMFLSRTFGAIVAVFLAVIYYWYVFLGFSTSLTYSSANCTLFNEVEMPASEDFAPIGNGKYFVSSGDLHNVFGNGASYIRGNIWMVDLASKDSTPTIVPIDLMPGQHPFTPHGIYFSQKSKLLYAITHGFPRAGGSRIVIARANATHHLSFVRYLISEHFPNGAINDVVEGDHPGELYVTIWLNFPMAARGRHHPFTGVEKLQKLAGLVMPVLYPGTYVLRCTHDVNDPNSPVKCKRAASGFYMANGITKRDNTYFVSDLIGKRVHILQRSPKGLLVPNGTIELKYAVDNLEYDAVSGEIHAGNVPILHAAMSKENDRTVVVPGGLTVLRAVNGHWQADEQVLMHDGAKMSQVSAAVRYKDVVALGTPYSHGMLVCRPEQQ